MSRKHIRKKSFNPLNHDELVVNAEPGERFLIHMGAEPEDIVLVFTYLPHTCEYVGCSNIVDYDEMPYCISRHIGMADTCPENYSWRARHQRERSD